jgi:DnaK suppressor protein
MEPEHARELLDRERSRIEAAIAAIEREGPLEGSDRREPGDEGSQDLYQDELNTGRLEDLRRQLAEVSRAEGRLEAGTYGISIESGDPIPDEQLEAVPTAERTVEEERRARGA